MPDSDMRPFLRRYILFIAGLIAIVLLALSARLAIDVFRRPAPTPPPDSPLPPPATPLVNIASVRAAAELATVDYRAVAEVPNERVPDDFRQYLGGAEQILLLAYGDVKAGFDLRKLSQDDIWTDGTRVQLHLPAPEILSSSIDFERTHVVYYQKSLLVSHDPNLESETLQIAKEAIQQAAIDAGIFEMAAEYGQLFFENYLRSLGFTEVQVVVN